MIVFTLSPFTPGTPGSPVKPGAPVFPEKPGTPLAPGSPLAPFSPSIPSIPGFPVLPGSPVPPGCPFKPRGPIRVYERITKIYLFQRKLGEIRHGGSAIWPFGELSRRVNSPAPARTSDLRAGKLEKWPTGSSQAVPHPSTIPARRCLTSVIGRERVLSSRYEATRRGLISRATRAVPKLRTLWQTSERSELPSAAVLSLAGPSAGSSRSAREPEDSSREIAVLTPARPFLGTDGLPAAVPGSGKVNPGPRCLFEGCRNFVRPLVAVTARGKAEVRCARSIARGGSCRARESSGRPVRTGRGCGGTVGRVNKSAGPFGGLRTSAVSRTSGRGDLGRKRHFWQFLEPGRAPEGPPGDRTDRR